MGGDGLVTVLDAEVTQGALVEVNTFGHSAQMCEMVGTKSMYETYIRSGLATLQVLDWIGFSTQIDRGSDFCHLFFDLR